MNQDKIDAMYDLLMTTSEAVEWDRKNFKIIAAELRRLNGNLVATQMINTILVGNFAAVSKEFKKKLKSSLEETLSCGHELPGDFEKQAKNIISAVCGSPVQEPQKPSFQLLDGGKYDSDK